MFRNLFARWWSRPARRLPLRRPMTIEALEDRVVPALTDFGSLSMDPSKFDQGHILVQVRPDVTDPTKLTVPQGVKFDSPVGLVPGLWEVSLSPGTTVQQALDAFKN